MEEKTQGGRLREFRERAGLSLRAAARRIGMAHSSLSSIELGNTYRLPSEYVAPLARLYGVTPDDILGIDTVHGPTQDDLLRQLRQRLAVEVAVLRRDRVGAYRGGEVPGDWVERYEHVGPELQGRQLVGFEVEDDTAAPLVAAGETAIADRVGEWREGFSVVAILAGAACVRQVERRGDSLWLVARDGTGEPVTGETVVIGPVLRVVREVRQPGQEPRGLVSARRG